VDHARALGRHPAPRAGEPDEPLGRRLGVEALEATLAEEVVLVGLDRPAEPDLERIGFRVRVLSDEDVLLLQPEDPLRLQTERTDPVRLPGRDDLVPHVLPVHRRHVDLVPQLADEPDPEHERRDTGHVHRRRRQVRDGLARDVGVGERPHHVARRRAGDVHRRVGAREVQDADVETQSAFHHVIHRSSAPVSLS
jgi:hypothetical protein